MSIDQIPTRPADVVKTAEAVNSLIQGKLNVTGTVTLTAGATSTIVTDNLFQSRQVVVLMPLTANAAGALATTYVSARNKGAFTLTHANAGTTDRQFAYIRLG